VECVRIIRDLKKRDSTWAALNDWTVDLLVECALASEPTPLYPAAAMIKVMKVRSCFLIKGRCGHRILTEAKFFQIFFAYEKNKETHGR
jgi:hypothetical protein